MENYCEICPRNCKVDRSVNLGFCKSTKTLKIAKVMKHYFEEPPISCTELNDGGSGAIFFSGCNLKCVYCQNEEISHQGIGKEISVEKLADIFRQLESSGANNINLVTPTHYTEQIIEALEIYRPRIPIVWNTSGYEKPEVIKRLGGYVDIFLTDFKYFDGTLAGELSMAKDYPDYCKRALLEMRKVMPEDKFDNGRMVSGIIVRHLILPGHTDDSLKIMDWICKNLGNKTYVSLMSQYVPTKKAQKYPKINRKIKPIEYKIVEKHLIDLNFENVFVQDYESADLCFTPNFLEKDDNFNY